MALIQIEYSPSRSQLRQFAAIWFPVFCCGALFLWWRMAHPSMNAIGMTGAFLAALSVIAFFAPPLARVLWIGLMTVTFPIGFVMSHITIGMVYYLVLTPIGLIMKLVGYDPMDRQLDRDGSSYWNEREAQPDPSRYFRQF